MTGLVYGALSCLQGRRAGDAADTLVAAGVDGIQLTPGCAPDGDIHGRLEAMGVPTRTHHGYSPTALRRKVWSNDGQLLVDAGSVHPPRAGQAAAFFALAENGGLDGTAVETMWPGWTLGCGDELDWAMRLGLDLAVDVSHLAIQRHAGVLSDQVLARVFDYDHISEAHLSQSDGRRDCHRTVDVHTWGLGWIRERHQDGLVVIVESYQHHLSNRQRAAQFNLVRETLA
jgi:hypothetical protein